MRRKSGGNRLFRNRLPSKILRGKTQLGIHEVTPILSEQTFLGQIKNHRSTKLLGGLITFFVTFFALSYPISDTLREPEIHHSTAQIDDPFSVRFSLHNPSVIFPMTDMRLSCVLLSVKRAEIPNLVGIPVDDGIMTIIAAGKTIEYECPIEKAIELDQVVQATIRIDVTFRTLGYERATQSELFNWDIVTRQWTKGKIIN